MCKLIEQFGAAGKVSRTFTATVRAAQVALVYLVVASVAHAQTAPQVRSALEAIRAQDQVLQTISDNLMGMEIGEDGHAVNSIMNCMNMFRGSDGTTIAVANLLPKMRDPEDANTVRRQLQYSLGLVLQVMDIAVKSTNGYMALMKGPAAIAEATKAREVMIAIRDQLRLLVTHS